MNDIDRNSRTLIVCFVIAIMSLTVLRFIEVDQNIMNVSNSQVLGETIQKNEEVVLPNAELEVLKVRYLGN